MFAVPFVQIQLPDTEPLNRELRSLFLRREAVGAQWSNPTPSMAIAPGLFESRFDLFMWPDASVQHLHDLCMGTLLRMVAEMNAYTVDDLRAMEMQNHAWFHITRRGGRFAAHNHPLASWSGVYCVDAGLHDAGHDDSGLLHFHNPHHYANMFKDAGNQRMNPLYSMAGRSFELSPGQLVLFPSWVVHEVLPYHGDGERITVAFNCWFRPRGCGQDAGGPPLPPPWG
jgi:uncharacterized protein (TIGR02466 family)